MEDYGKKSVFNAGVAQTERIDNLQKAINYARFNPTFYNMDIGKFNYEILVASNDGLLAEVWSKLSTKERIVGERIRKAVTEYLEQNKIIYYHNGEQKINLSNLKRFNELIILYERYNKDFLDVHNLNSPNMDDDEGEL